MPNEEAAPQPKAILRGHKAAVHAAAFVRNGERLVTGDADGFVILWDLTIARPRAVWQAHANSILGIAEWGNDRLVTHGRDNKLVVWKLGKDDELALSTTLPLDPSAESRPQPWILFLLEVNTMNFCAFSSCSAPTTASEEELLIAVPNTLASEAIDIFHLPSQHRIHTVKLGDKNGMVMALSIFRQGAGLVIAAGYESGLTIMASLDEAGTSTVLYRAHPHSQPILSLDIAPDRSYFLTSSADAIIAKHPIPSINFDQTPGTATVLQDITDHPGSSRPRETNTAIDKGKSKAPVSLLSAALAAAPSHPAAAKPAPLPKPEVQTTPISVVNTKYAGQQSLRIRSDGRVFATAGWDARARVYSRTMREVAVLKWHQTGCYAVAFAPIATREETATPAKGGQDDRVPLSSISGSSEDTSVAPLQGGSSRSSEVSRRGPRHGDLSVKERRIRYAQTAHWLAVGSKDGRVSLWDVF